MTRTKKPELTAWLPPTAVTPKMRKTIEAKAARENISIGELQRRALSLFLAQNDTKTVEGDIKSVNGGNHATTH